MTAMMSSGVHPQRRWIGLALLGVLAGVLRATAEPLPPEAVEFFEKSVRPVLVDHCYSCHSAGAEKIRGDLLLDSAAGWRKGGASGKPAVLPGDVEASPLVRAIRHADPDLAMPPKKKLPDDAIAALEQWVRMGAPDPRTGGTTLPDPKELGKRHWAFQPVSDPPLPTVKDPAWVRNGIDRFVLARLEAEGMRPAPAADRRTLIRRASIVLTGLMPTADEVRAFEADPSSDAFERVVDRLLASPRYGERWARHWLDVARYADTKGYVFEEERRYPYAYTYRDYVIRAFNDDKPYDQFLIEQIAADQVVGADDPDRSALAAMGFLTLGRRFLNNPHDIIDDRIDVLMRGTMALTVACARCHDHKYDPIPAADYYSLYGVFASSHEPPEKPLLGVIPDPEGYERFRTELSRRERERDEFVSAKEALHRKKLRESVGDYLLAVKDSAAMTEASAREELARSRKLSPDVLERWRKAGEEKRLPEALFGPWNRWAGLAEADFAAQAAGILQSLPLAGDGAVDARLRSAFEEGGLTNLNAVVGAYNRAFAAASAATGDNSLKAFLDGENSPVGLKPAELHRLFDVPEGQRMRALQRSVEELAATHPGAPPRGMVLADNAAPTEPVIFKRGNPGNRGDTVPRRFLEVVAGPERPPFQQGSGRLELAQAIASPGNPLTARVAVNRVWLHHFGNGLVRTPSDFGLRSEPPTHPELLDWLATRLVEGGWSIKQLQRMILLSATWQQSSEAPPAVLEKDPENRWLSRQIRRRLDFESMRDLLLAAGGRLDLRMGGPSVEITTVDYTPRRTVYGMVERQNLPGVFRTFDFASPDTTSSQRFQTTVPQQALFLMNHPFSLDQARGLIARPEVRAITDPDARIRRLYDLVMQREADPAEVALGRRFLLSQPDLDRVPLPVWQYGRGRLDRGAEVVREFVVLPHYTGQAWQGGPKLPDPRLGWVLVNAVGGHPGGNEHGAVVRRWTAPAALRVSVSGLLKHPADAGDGVRAAVVSSRHGIVGEWTARQSSTDTRVEQIEVLPGDWLDFVVECGADENSDGFEWAPRVGEVEAAAGMVAQVWDARAEFGGPASVAIPLTAWERFAQVLLLANETMFVD